MGLRKGTTNNPAGRPKGSTNKVAEEVRSSFEKLIRKNLSGLQNDLAELTPKDRIATMLKLSEFVLPRLKTIDEESKFTTQEYAEYQKLKAEKEKYANMTQEELDEILEKLMEEDARYRAEKK